MIRRKRFAPNVYAGIVARQNGKCACGCGEPLGDPRDIEFDHALDLQWGGQDTPENLRALLKRHHLEKTVRGHKDRAKVERIRQQDGLRKRKMNARDKAMAKMMERG